MNLTKKIWFDENSMPPKNMIWYKGEGKFYEWKNGEWVLCYNLVNAVTQEQMEQNNYVIDQALNDLNERVEELQSQAAQQDNLFIDVTTLGTFTDAQKAKLVEYYKAGTILNVVQRSAVGVSKCIHASYVESSTTRTYTFVFGSKSSSGPGGGGGSLGLQSATVTETIEA